MSKLAKEYAYGKKAGQCCPQKSGGGKQAFKCGGMVKKSGKSKK